MFVYVWKRERREMSGRGGRERQKEKVRERLSPGRCP
jgi:hypothetical protein